MIGEFRRFAAHILGNRSDSLRHWLLLFLAAFVWLLGPNATPVRGQTYLQDYGTPKFTSQLPVENGYVDASNGRLHLQIPLGSYSQRGGRTYSASLIYDSNFWTGSAQPTNITNAAGTANSWSGWRIVTSGDAGNSGYYRDWYTYWCAGDGTDSWWSLENFSEFVWNAPDGTSHSFPITTHENQDTACHPYPWNDQPDGGAFASDGSGYYMKVTNYTDVEAIYAPDGTQIPWKDSNGNGVGSTDTLGRTLFSTSTNGNTITVTMPNAQGGTKTYTITLETINVYTKFQTTGVTDYNGTITVVQSVELPDGTSYSFGYDSGTTQGTNGHFGFVNSMQLPTGSTISYQYLLYQDSAGTKYPWITHRTTPDGTWIYAQGVVSTCGTNVVNCQQTNTVTKPSGDTDVLTFTLNGGAWNNEIQYYSGSPTSGTIQETLTDCWNFVTITNGTCTYSTTSGSGATGVQKIAETTTLPVPGSSNVYKTTEYSYDGYGNTIGVGEWNFYTGTLPTTADRTTTINYLGTTNYVNALIINRPTSVTVTDKNGSTVAQTNYSYDTSSLTSAIGRQNHDDTNYGTSNTVRGNVTQIQRLVSGTSTYLTTTLTYDTLGNVLTSTDPNGNQTTFDYTDNFYDDPGDGSTPTAHSLSTPTNAFVKTITYPTVNSVTLTQSLGYYWGTGQQALSTDANGNTSYSHFYEALNRPTSTALPNNEWTRIVYNSTDTQADSYLGTTNSSASTSCSVCRHDQTTLDGMGRATSQRLVNDPDGEIYVNTTYDSDGRVATVSNPYRGSSNGVETPGYDGLDRTTQVTHADSDVAHTYYGASVGTGGGKTSQGCSGYGLGYPTLTVDEIGNKRQTWTDGFGRVIETDEPDSSGSLTIYTCYTYDLNNNLTGVTATGGTQTRSYSYDKLSRVLSKTLPESKGGTTNYYYTTSGGGLCSGDPTAVCRRTDARSITTTYTYDALNRLTSMSYNDSSPTTPTVNYYYDQTSYNSLTITSGKGRRTGMSDGSGETAWSYDSVGDVLTEKRTVNSVTKTISYTYNLDGTIATVTYPGSRVVTYAEGNAQRPTAAQDTTNSINYATSPSSGSMYSPTGAPADIIHGYVSGGFAGITETYTYNNRLQVTGIEATSSAGTPLNLSYSYAQSSHDNGNVATQTNNVTSGRTQTYTYDSLNRLLTAQASATSGNDCWGQGFGNNATPPTLGDDALANLLAISATKCSSPALSVSVNGYNQISSPTGYSYDNAGNMTADNSYTYTYDAENRIRSADVGGTYYCYIYDGNGMRVEKATASSSACTSPTAYELYWRNTAGNTIAETDGSGSTTNSSYNEYVFFAGRRIAQSNPSSGAVNYYFVDHLGSTRVVTDAIGSACFEVDYFPYGQEKTPAGFTDTCSTHYKFTGYERDPETDPGNGTGNDYAFARYYSPRLGRFMSADPLDGDISDPQTLNKYSYVRNNPVNLVDPWGLCSDSASAYSYTVCADPFNFDLGDGVWSTLSGWSGTSGGGGSSYSPTFTVWYPPPPPKTPAQQKRKSTTPPQATGRACTSGTASVGQYVAATAQVAAMTGEFFSGLGAGNQTFGPGSATSQVMAQSGPVQDVLNSYYMTGQTSGLYTFGGSGYVAAGGNPVAQFVGSFRWSITPGNSGINLSLTNTTSFRSLTYDKGSQWQRGSLPTPMGNTHQTYNITATCH